MYETYYDKVQPLLEQDKVQFIFTDCDSFVLIIRTQYINKDLKNLENLFDFSNLDVNHELLSNKKKKAMGKPKIETPKNFYKEEFVALRSKMYAFKCGDVSRNNLKDN